LDKAWHRLNEQQKQLPGLTLTPFFVADEVLRLLRTMAATITELDNDVSALRTFYATQSGPAAGVQRAVQRLADSLGEQVVRTGSTLQGRLT